MMNINDLIGNNIIINEDGRSYGFSPNGLRNNKVVINEVEYSPILIESDSTLAKNIAGEIQKTFTILPDGFYRNLRYVEYGGVYYVMCGDCGLVINSTMANVPRDEPSEFTLTKNSEVIVIHDSVLLVKDDVLGVTGVSLISESVVDCATLTIAYSASVRQHLLANKIFLTNAIATEGFMIGTEINLLNAKVFGGSIGVRDGVNIGGIGNESISVNISNNQFCEYTYFTVESGNLPDYIELYAPYIGRYKSIAGINITTRYDYGRFGDEETQFLRANNHDIIVGGCYMEGDKFTLTARRYCKENGCPDYELNGLKMLNEDVLFDNTATLSDCDYYEILESLDFIISPSRPNYEVHKGLIELIFGIRSRLNTYKSN